MNKALLLHNPKAGDEDHEKEELLQLVESAGYQCRYSSTKRANWANFKKDINFIVAAGGDGTVRKITKELLDRKVLEKTYPIALLPLGTANNISKTLHIQGEWTEIAKRWNLQKIKQFDVGLCSLKQPTFFLESFGYGIFPYLMKKMDRLDEEPDTPEESLQTALKTLLKILTVYEPRHCRLQIDGHDHSGVYLLAEVMNTRSIGPNLCLNPNGDPGDGILEVVVVPAEQKEQFAAFVKSKLTGEAYNYNFVTYRGKKINISWQGTHVHIDDETIKIKENAAVNIEIRKGLLQFLV